MIDEHLDDAAWEQLALGELAADARAARLRHVAACADCARIWLGLRALAVDAAAVDPGAVIAPAGLDDDEPGELDDESDDKRNDRDDKTDAHAGDPPAKPNDDLAARRRRRLGRALMIGGGVLLAAAAVALWLGPVAPPAPREPDDVVRGDPTITVIAEAPRGAVGPGAQLAWTPLADATLYRVVIHDAEGRRVWGPTEVAAPPLALPPLAAGAYRWQVEALRAGAVVARSPLTAFSVTP